LSDAAIWITAQAGILAAEVFFVGLYVQRQYDIEDESRRLGSPFNRSSHEMWGCFARHADGRLSYKRVAHG